MRNIKNADALVNGAYKAFIARVQLVVVPDITVEGAFDELVQGIYILSLIHLIFFSFSFFIIYIYIFLGGGGGGAGLTYQGMQIAGSL